MYVPYVVMCMTPPSATRMPASNPAHRLKSFPMTGNVRIAASARTISNPPNKENPRQSGGFFVSTCVLNVILFTENLARSLQILFCDHHDGAGAAHAAGRIDASLPEFAHRILQTQDFNARDVRRACFLRRAGDFFIRRSFLFVG